VIVDENLSVTGWAGKSMDMERVWITYGL
jgi:hypothetical protein